MENSLKFSRSKFLSFSTKSMTWNRFNQICGNNPRFLAKFTFQLYAITKTMLCTVFKNAGNSYFYVHTFTIEMAKMYELKFITYLIAKSKSLDLFYISPNYKMAHCKHNTSQCKQWIENYCMSSGKLFRGLQKKMCWKKFPKFFPLPCTSRKLNGFYKSNFHWPE